jgi:hypothetical protein
MAEGIIRRDEKQSTKRNEMSNNTNNPLTKKAVSPLPTAKAKGTPNPPTDIEHLLCGGGDSDEATKRLVKKKKAAKKKKNQMATTTTTTKKPPDPQAAAVPVPVPAAGSVPAAAAAAAATSASVASSLPTSPGVTPNTASVATVVVGDVSEAPGVTVDSIVETADLTFKGLIRHTNKRYVPFCISQVAAKSEIKHSVESPVVHPEAVLPVVPDFAGCCEMQNRRCNQNYQHCSPKPYLLTWCSFTPPCLS